MLNWTDERLIDTTGITNGATARPTDFRSRLQVLEDEALERLQIAEDTLNAGGRTHQVAMLNYDKAQAKLDRHIARLEKYA